MNSFILSPVEYVLHNNMNFRVDWMYHCNVAAVLSETFLMQII